MAAAASRLLMIFLVGLVLSSLIAFQPAASSSRLTDPFSARWILTDTNGDGVIDFVAGKVVVPSRPSAAENAAAADIAARLGFGSTGLTPPVVISADEDRADGPRIYVGRGAIPSRVSSAADEKVNQLQAEEGGVFALDGNLAIFGHDDSGLLAAAEAFAARAPFVWRMPGETLSAIAQVIDQSISGTSVQITGVTYV